MNKIIESYDIRLISRMAFPQALQKREPETKKEVSKNIGGLLLFLFSMPLLIPLGIVYLVFIIVVFILVVSSFIVGITGLIGFVVLVIQTIKASAGISSSMAAVGAYISIMALTTLIMYYITYGFGYLLKGSVKLISRLIGGGTKNESYR